MAWTFLLSDSTTTLNLADGTIYFVNVGGFAAPSPRRRLSMSGANLFRHGEDLIARTYENRTVTVKLQIKGANATALGTAVTDVWNLLRKAEEFSKDGLGTQVQLLYGWDGAVGTVGFNVIEGALDLGPDLHGPHLLKGTRIRNAQLELLCEPFAVGTAESLSNYLADPSFEIAGSALADWTVNDAARVVRSTATAYYGTASMLMTTTSTAVRPQATQQVLTTAGSVWSIGVRLYPSAMSGQEVKFILFWYDTAGGLISSTGVVVGTSTGTFIALALANQTAPANTGTLQFRIWLESLAGATGTCYWDGAIAVKASALPQAWVSGRDVRNHFDDKGQAHINYLDVYDVPGDVPAALQVKAVEKEAHTQFWLGARHDGRLDDPGIFLEAEAFSTNTGGGTWTGTANAVMSGGSAIYGPGGTNFSTAASNPNVIIFNMATPPPGIYRTLVRIRNSYATNFYAGAGYSYGSATFTPSSTSHYTAMGTITAFQIVDAGAVTIPPVEVPVGGSPGTFSLRLAMFGHEVSSSSTLDYVMLLPVGQGMVYGTKASATEVLWADSRSPLQGLYVMNTADVMQQFPGNQVGQPPQAHPKGSRLYMLGANAPGSVDQGWNVTLTYVSRWLHVR